MRFFLISQGVLDFLILEFLKMRIFRKTLEIWQGIFWLKMRVFFISQGVLNFGILEFFKMRVFRKTLAIWQGVF